MTAPIGGLGGPGPKRIGLDIAGEGGIGRSKLSPTDGPSFGDTLKRALGEVSSAQDKSQDSIQRFVRGEPVELHQVMAAAEEAQISLEMLVELRNKLTDAYKAVINMS
ncbi:MAG TPA: flagellar hook-basal body complex protein FliE [Gemmatimonadaceae bacterium]|nr:flagellar hook-basal body complex protein FliE [Gemmatimonadaceae bacterium]